MLSNVQSSSMVLTGNSMGIAVKFGINTTSVALKMGKAKVLLVQIIIFSYKMYPTGLWTQS